MIIKSRKERLRKSTFSFLILFLRSCLNLCKEAGKDYVTQWWSNYLNICIVNTVFNCKASVIIRLALRTTLIKFYPSLGADTERVWREILILMTLSHSGGADCLQICKKLGCRKQCEASQADWWCGSTGTSRTLQVGLCFETGRF